MSVWKRFVSIQSALLLIGTLLLAQSVLWQSEKPRPAGQRGRLEKSAVTAVLSFGHREFAWSLWAMSGLSAAVNMWHMENNKTLTAEQLNQQQRRFNEFIDNLDEFSREALGMREIFIFPASYLAFVKSDLASALKIASLGASDPRLQVDLQLIVAYLTHLFGGDLKRAALEYEKLLSVFPQSTWLKKTIDQLNAGVDPFLESGKKRNNCKRLLTLFPLSRNKLIERNICPDTPIGGESDND